MAITSAAELSKMIRLLYVVYICLIGVWKAIQEQLYDRQRALSVHDLYDLTGKLVVITGGTRGIGLEAVKKLLTAGAHVLIGCRNVNEAQSVLSRYQDQTNAKGSFECLPLDLTSMASVSNFAEQILRKKLSIHVLINNAGIMFGPRVETLDGLESQMATNFFGHFLLTHKLLPRLRDAGNDQIYSRIVNVSSAAHYTGSWMDFEDLNLKSGYNPEKAYGQSKAAQILFTKSLDRQLRQESDRNFVSVLCLHPGLVNTDLYTGIMKILNLIVGRLVFKKASQGGDTLVHAAISPTLEKQSGVYLENLHLSTCSSFCNDPSNQKRLFEKTCDILNIRHFGEMS